jgi:O-antigen chain-terminating methyltransferase
MDASEPSVDELVALLQARVAQRRAAGEYPADLEERLEAHYRRLVGPGSGVSPQRWAELDARIAALEGTGSGRRSRGARVEQDLENMRAAIETLARLTRAVHDDLRESVTQQLDDLRADLGRIARAVRTGGGDANEPEGDEPDDLRAWFGWDEFERAFRGSEASVRDRYRDLAQRFAGCAPVLDVGFGRGEFLDLLGEIGVEARGIEVDADLVHTAAARGLDVRIGDAAAHLATLDDASLGGVCALQVVEHLSSQEYVDFPRLLARVVRPGGLVIVDSPNPSSFYVYAHAFYLDPTHTRPVHPLFLMFLFDRAGFEKVELEWRSPPPDAALLEPVPGDDATTRAINENIARLNAVLYGPQDFAIIARR